MNPKEQSRCVLGETTTNGMQSFGALPTQRHVWGSSPPLTPAQPHPITSVEKHCFEDPQGTA